MTNELFLLERGDPDKLAWRVVVYSRLKNPPVECKNISHAFLYAGTHPFDIYEAEQHEEIGKTLKNFNIDGDNLRGPRRVSQGIVSGFARRLFGTNDLAEAFKLEGDLVNAGVYPILGHAAKVMDYFGLAYMAKYVSQWSERFPRLSASQNKPVEDLSGGIHNQLQNRLYALVADLIQGVSSNNSAVVNSAKGALTQFGASSGMRRELEDLISFAEGSSPNKLPLTRNQIEMITAIRAERYEEAARFRDQINVLR